MALPLLPQVFRASASWSISLRAAERIKSAWNMNGALRLAQRLQFYDPWARCAGPQVSAVRFSSAGFHPGPRLAELVCALLDGGFDCKLDSMALLDAGTLFGLRKPALPSLAQRLSVRLAEIAGRSPSGSALPALPVLMGAMGFRAGCPPRPAATMKCS